MLLSQTAVYGLRALAVLAQLGTGDSLNAEELARRTGVPRQYLSKVMRRLVLARLVLSQRGHGGGFRLQRPPGEIQVHDALLALDLHVDTRCAFGFERCDPVKPCALHPLWNRLRESLDQWTRGSTFAALQAPPADVPAPCRTANGA